MIDLRAFRGLVDRGLISAEDFVTIETGQQQVVTRHFKNAPVVRKFYEDKTRYKVRLLFDIHVVSSLGSTWQREF